MTGVVTPRFGWFAAAEAFANAYRAGVAWSTTASAWFVRTWYLDTDRVAWIPNAGFVRDLLPEYLISTTGSLADFGRAVHVARMLLARNSEPATWEPEAHLDTLPRHNGARDFGGAEQQ